MQYPATLDEALNWEDFDSAISAEDCFGPHCGRASGALSMLQQRTGQASKATPVEHKDTASMSNHEKDSLSAALESEIDSDMGALSLVQTGASVERTSLVSGHAPVAAAALADGSIEINPKKAAVSKDGMMQFSVDASGTSQGEDSLFLMQTESHLEKKHIEDVVSLVQADAHVAKKSASSQTGAVAADGTIKLNSRKVVASSSGSMAFSMDGNGNLEAEEGTAETLSLVQTDALVEQRSPTKDKSVVSGSVQSDGSIEMNSNKVEAPSDGRMSFSFDADGSMHAEGLSLIQTDAYVSPARLSPAVEEHPSWSTEALSGDVLDIAPAEALSLVQTDAKVEKRKINTRKVPADGATQFSVDSRGHFIKSFSSDHFIKNDVEGVSLIQTNAQIQRAGSSLTEAAHPEWSMEALSAAISADIEPAVEAVSLVQTDAKVERRKINTRKVPEVGMQFSVDSRGHFIKNKRI